jgi:hypothetical protein
MAKVAIDITFRSIPRFCLYFLRRFVRVTNAEKCVYRSAISTWETRAVHPVMVAHFAQHVIDHFRCISFYTHLLHPLIFNVFLNRIEWRTANGHNEIARTPKMSAPKAIFNPLELLKQSSSRNAFQAINQFRDLLVRFHPDNDMNMVNFIFCCQQFYICLFTKFFQYLSQPIAYFSIDYSAAIFNAPNNVILELIHRMRTALKFVFHSCLKIWGRLHHVQQANRLDYEIDALTIQRRLIQGFHHVACNRSRLRRQCRCLCSFPYLELYQQPIKKTSEKFNVYRIIRYCNQLSQSQALSLLWDAKFIPHLKERVFFRGIDKSFLWSPF